MTITEAAIKRYTAGTCRPNDRGYPEPVTAIRYPNGEVAVVQDGALRRYSASSTAARTFHPSPAHHAVLVAELAFARAELAHTKALDDHALLQAQADAAYKRAQEALVARDAADRRLEAVRKAAAEWLV